MALTKSMLARVERVRNSPDIQAIGWRIHIVKECDWYLASLARSVRECKRVDEASRFARWLEFSAVLEVLKEYPQTHPAADMLRARVVSLGQACGDLYGGGIVRPAYSESDISEINAKLDRLLTEQKPVSQNGVGTGVGGLSDVRLAQGEPMQSGPTASEP